MKEILQLAAAILASIGSAGAIFLGLSSWLGKIWANRILESDRAKYQKEIEELKNKYQLRIKEFEIKTNMIQEKRNGVILDLAPVLSQAYSHCYVYAELGTMNLPPEGTDEIRRLSSKSLETLWTEFRKAELYLSDDFFDRLGRFQRSLWELQKAVSDTLYPGEINPDTGEVLNKRDINEIFEELKTHMSSEEKAIITEFRNILGTNPLEQFQQAAARNEDKPRP